MHSTEMLNFAAGIEASKSSSKYKATKKGTSSVSKAPESTTSPANKGGKDKNLGKLNASNVASPVQSQDRGSMLGLAP